MQPFAQHRAFVGFLLAGLLAAVEVAWEPWHVFSVDHLESGEVAVHAKAGGDHSHHDDHDEHHDHEQEHEHHPVIEHEQTCTAGQFHSPVFVAAVLPITIVDAAAPATDQVAPDVPSVPANESPPDRRLSQRGPPRA